jgi:hypothetical protein
MVPPSPPSHLEGVAQGKHIDGGDVRRLAGRPRAFGNAIAVFARGERGAATAIRASLMDMTENSNSRKGYLRNYMRANTASSGKISLSKQHAPVGSLIEPSATSR